MRRLALTATASIHRGEKNATAGPEPSLPEPSDSDGSKTNPEKPENQSEFSPGTADAARHQIAFPRSTWAFSGFSSPESSLQSILWAGAVNDPTALIRGVDSAELDRVKRENGSDDSEALRHIASSMIDVTNFQVVKSERISDLDSIVTADILDSSGHTQTKQFAFRRDRSDWLYSGLIAQ